MLQRLIILWFGLLVILPVHGDDLPPLIYYYAPAENAFLVEHADGTATVKFASSISDDAATFIVGGGWSPDGNYFVYGMRPYNRPNGYIVNVRSSEVQPINLWRVGDLHWSPDSQYLLVSGNIDPCDAACSQETNWLIGTDEGDILAWLDIRRAIRSPGRSPIEWDDTGVTFYTAEEAFPNSRLSSTYRITMNANGEVIKQPISLDAYNNHFVPLDESLDLQNRTISSPDERYTISSTGQLTDTVTQSSAQLLMPDFGLGDHHPVRIDDAQWHASGDWVLVYYNIWSGGIDGVSIMRSDGGDYRQLTTCGSSLSCVGWLPDSVEIENLDLSP